MPCSPRRYFTTASSRSRRPSRRWRPPASRFASDERRSRVDLMTTPPLNSTETTGWLDQVRWSPDGLVAAIAQDAASGKVLTLAWMNRDALARTVETGEAH